MSKVGRNDPCPCGSGRKYKKCCEKKVIQLGSLHPDELFDAINAIMEYGLKYEHLMKEFLEERTGHIAVPEGLAETFGMHMLFWAVTTAKLLPNDSTILEKYIQDKSGTIKNSRLRKVVKSWVKVKPEIFEFNKLEKDIAKAVDLITGEEKNIRILSDIEFFKERDYRFFFGFVAPYENEYVLLFPSLPLYERNMDELDYQREKLKILVEEEDESKLLMEYLPEFLDVFFLETFIKLNELEWDKPEYEKVADLIETIVWVDSEDADMDLVEFILPLWKCYVDRKAPNIRKPPLYAAAMQYICYDLLFRHVYQEEIAEIYGVPVNSLGAKVREIREVLKEELSKVQQLLNEEYDLFDYEEENDFFEQEEEKIIDFLQFKEKRK